MKKRRFFSICFLFFVSFQGNSQEVNERISYPPIEEQVETTSYYGHEVKDEYHNLNSLNKKEVQQWFAAQDSLAENYFSSSPHMEDYLERFTKLQNLQDGDISLIKKSESGNYFYLKYDAVRGVDILYFRKSLADEEIELYDPSFNSEEYRDITYLKPSFDGKKIAVGFNQEEDFSSEIRIFDVDGKKILKEKITNINPDFGGIEWLPDNSGFIYLYFPVIDNNENGYKKNSYSVIYKLGEDPGERNFLFGRDNKILIPEDFYPKVKIGSSIDKYIIGYSANSGDFYDAYIAKTEDVLSGNPNWKTFFTKNQQIFTNEGEIRNDNFIFRQGNDTGNTISQVRISNPDFAHPEIIAEGSQTDPITSFEITKNKIYYVRAKFGVELSLYEVHNGMTTELKTPFIPGYITFFGASAANNSIGVELDGWISDYTRFLIKKDGTFIKEDLKPEINYPEFENLKTEVILVKSHDGVEVPLSLVYDKRFSGSAEREVFIYVYGAYGEIMSPFFYPIFLDWAVQGGILAFPHVRGGGEKGKDWHTQGMKNLKYNSWKDLIACTEALIYRGYTRKGLIALYTPSAGGITGGMAVNERPDLFSSFIAEVPRLNPLGLESSETSSSTSYLEYGTIKDSLEFLGLLKMDPYLNLKSGKDYPATLVMPSYNDDRIPLWDSGKYVAKLQAVNAADTPVLMDINYDSGHGKFNGYDDTVKHYSKIFTFAQANLD